LHGGSIATTEIAMARAPDPKRAGAPAQAPRDEPPTRPADVEGSAIDPRAGGGADPRGDADVRADDPRRNDGGGREGRPANAPWADRGVVEAPGSKTVWVLVADEALARILCWRGPGEDLQDVEALADPSAHVREGEFERDAAGRRAGGTAEPSRADTSQRLRGTASITASAGEEAQHQEAHAFARRVAQHLGEAWRQKRFDELRIVAAPRFLGELRKTLDAHVSAAVSGELNKDLIHLPNDELTRRLFAGEPGGAGA
jgi:protein required for attachment to host cells